MKPKKLKKKLSVNKKTIANLSFVTHLDEGQDKIKGKGEPTWGKECNSRIASCNTQCGGTCYTCYMCPNTNECTVNVQTYLGDENGCNPNDTFPPGGGVCP